MSISAEELRDTDIRERVRGYDKDEVNALLERAAQAIEALDAPIRELEAR